MPAVCRGDQIDADVPHCGIALRDVCSDTVFANGTGISREDDNNTTHLLPGTPTCPSHVAPIAVGSTTVFINGKGCGRVGDSITACTSVATGSSNVFAGG